MYPTGIPALSMGRRDQARRLITLIDELYNARCLLVRTAAAFLIDFVKNQPSPPPNIYTERQRMLPPPLLQLPQIAQCRH